MFTTLIFFAANISFVTVSPLIVLAVNAGTLLATGDACAVFVVLSPSAESEQPLIIIAA